MRSLALLLCLASLTNGEVLWAKLGEPVTLKWPESRDSELCLIKAPFKDAAIPAFQVGKWENLSVLDGCDVEIKSVQDKHVGEWTSTIYYGDDGQDTRSLEVKIAEMASSLVLEDVTTKEENTTASPEFRCTIDKSEPRPTIKWFVDDEALVDLKVQDDFLDNGDMVQTLFYQPQTEHSNKTLRCVANFAEFGFSEVFEDALTIEFSETEIETIISEVGNRMEAAEEEDEDSLTVVVGILLIVFVVCLVIVALVFTLKNRFCCKTDKVVDAESATDNTKTDDDSCEKVDLTKEEEAKVASTENNGEAGDAPKTATLGDKFKSLFKDNKSFVNDETETVTEAKKPGFSSGLRKIFQRKKIDEASEDVAETEEKTEESAEGDKKVEEVDNKDEETLKADEKEDEKKEPKNTSF